MPWYILLAILVFGLLIFIHELGHYLMARLFGVEINEFSIGMGPKIIGWKSKKYDTQYCLRALPIGGYVSMVGEDGESENANAFINKKVWQKLLVVAAGPVMNLLLGFVTMAILVGCSGPLYSNDVVYPENLEKPTLTQTCGLVNGDKILRVGRRNVHTRYEVVYEVMHSGTEPVDLVVLRDGEMINLPDVTFPTATDSGMVFGGVDFYAGEDDFTIGNFLKHTFFRSTSTVKMIVDSFVDLLRGKYGLEAVSGPVGITKTIGESVEGGWSNFLFVFVVITINLGVFNLFPIPALDGGRLLFLLIELVIGRRLNPKIEEYINTAGLVLMLGFVLVITCKDIIGLF